MVVVMGVLLLEALMDHQLAEGPMDIPVLELREDRMVVQLQGDLTVSHPQDPMVHSSLDPMDKVSGVLDSGCL